MPYNLPNARIRQQYRLGAYDKPLREEESRNGSPAREDTQESVREMGDGTKTPRSNHFHPSITAFSEQDPFR